MGENAASLEVVTRLQHLRDVNDEQMFPLTPAQGCRHSSGRVMKLTFNGSTDFYGRITLYKLEVFGSEGISEI